MPNPFSPVPFQFAYPTTLLLLAPLLFYFAALNRRTVTDMSQRRRRLALAVRCVLATLLVFVLAGFRWVRKSDSLAVIFVVDGSKSIRDDAARFDAEVPCRRDAGHAQRGQSRSDHLCAGAAHPVLARPAARYRQAARSRRRQRPPTSRRRCGRPKTNWTRPPATPASESSCFRMATRMPDAPSPKCRNWPPTHIVLDTVTLPDHARQKRR